MTDERLSCLAILYIHKNKDEIDVDSIITEFARLKGTVSHFACNLLEGVTVLPFFCRKHCTLPITLEMGENKQLITAIFPSSLFTENVLQNAGDGISETLHLKHFLGEHAPRLP